MTDLGAIVRRVTDPVSNVHCRLLSVQRSSLLIMMIHDGMGIWIDFYLRFVDSDIVDISK